MTEIFQHSDVFGYWPLIIGMIGLLFLELVALKLASWMDFQFRSSKLLIFLYISVFNFMICYEAVISVRSFLFTVLNSTKLT